MFKYRCLLLLLIAVLGSCSGKQNGAMVGDMDALAVKYPVVVPFESGINTEKEVLLSQIADKVEFVPLETGPSCLIKRIAEASVFRTAKYWLIPWVEDLFQFATDGTFIRKIGRKGQGPGEFNYIQHIDVNEAEGLLYMMTTGKLVNVYELETGKFLRTIPVPGTDATHFSMLNDSTLAFYVPNTNGQRKERVLVSDLKGDTIHAFLRENLFSLASGYSYMLSSSSDRYMFHYDDLVCYKEYYNDTLFTVTKDELLPRYILDLGKYSIPLECRFEYLEGNWNQFQSASAPYLCPQAIETGNYLFMPYANWGGEKAREEQMAIYDKKENTCFKVTGGFVKNDMEGSLPLRPATALDKNTLLSVWSVSDIMEKAEKDPSIMEFESFKQLKEEDNPVLMVVHLKK